MSDYAIIRADGYYGDVTSVLEVYETRADALAAATTGYQAIEMADAEIGRKVHRTDMGRIYARVEVTAP